MTFRDFYTVTVREHRTTQHEFHFVQPPSREEFLEACRVYFPWTIVWEQAVFPAIRENTWPILDAHHKYASTEIFGPGDVRPWLYVSVGRDSVAVNAGYDRDRAVVSFDAEERELKKIPKAKRSEAGVVILRAENSIREALLALPLDADLDAETAKLIRRVLVDAGLRKTP